MKYKHNQVFRVSGISPPSENKEIIFLQDKKLNIKAISSSNVDSYCFETDTQNAIASLILAGPWGEKDKDKVPQAIMESIKRIQEDRKNKIKSGTAIILQVEGEIENLQDSTENEFDDFSIWTGKLHDSDIEKITSASVHAKNLLLVSLFLGANHPIEIGRIDSGVYLENNNKRICYPFSIKLGIPKFFCSEVFNDTLATEVNSYFDIIKRSNLLDRVFRLLSQAIDGTNDNLRSFIFACTALEVFINKIFKEYEKEFLAFLDKSSGFNTSKIFLNRISEVMRDKYKLQDKFVIITSFLKDEEAELMLEWFKKIKKCRDQMFHGEEIEEATLPTDDVINIIKIYLKKHIDKLSA